MMKTVSQRSISHSSAVELVQAALDYALEHKIAIAACVVDLHGRVKVLTVMDGTALIADELVIKKAKTALSGLSSGQFAAAVAEFPAVEKSMLALSSITLLSGGYPLLQDEEIIGGFAVGGATVDMDIACAEAALKAIKNKK